MRIIGPKVWPAGASKDPKQRVIRFFMKKCFKGCGELKVLCRKAVDQISGS
jgi:hypothetical protein